MVLNSLEFVEKLNHCLDEMDAPKRADKRESILADMLHISKFQAGSLLSGRQLPDQELLNRMALEFDVELEWFSGNQKDSPAPSR